MANTVIQIKYSTATASPSTLNIGELAYSYNSGNLFVGNTTSNGAVVIGGSFFTNLVSQATSSNTASAIVRRDVNGNFSASQISANLDGNALTATKWQTARNIGVTGDATGNVSVDGTAAAAIPLVLQNTGVTANNYGGAGFYPVFTVDSKGRITSAANIALSSGSVTAAGNTGTGSFTSTLNVKGGGGAPGSGITTNFSDSDDTFYVSVDSTVLRTTGNQLVAGDLSISGNLFVTGTQTYVNTSTLQVSDSLIKLAANNTGDTLDIGFYGQYSSTNYTGLLRQAAGNYFLFKNIVADPTGNVLVANSLTAQNTATLRANITGGTVSSLAAAIGIADGGTNATSFTTGPIIYFDGTKQASLANVSAVAGTYDAATTFTAFSSDAYGRVTGVTASNIAISAAQIVSGNLGVARGGTGNTTFTANGVIFAGITSTSPLLSVASSTEGHVLQINTTGIPTFAHLSGGTF